MVNYSLRLFGTFSGQVTCSVPTDNNTDKETQHLNLFLIKDTHITHSCCSHNLTLAPRALVSR